VKSGERAGHAFDPPGPIVATRCCSRNPES